MDEKSLEGRVKIRYVGSEDAFPRMTYSYDEDRRALVIDPGQLLVVGRDVEVLLLPGIVDTDGLALTNATGQEEALYRMRHRVVPTAGDSAGS
jgi:hypothetical protein